LINSKLIQEEFNLIYNVLDFGDLKDKTILVSGASGFLASYFVYFLIWLNLNFNLNIKIICIVRDLYKARTKFGDYLSQVILIRQDIAEAFIIDGSVDIIIHAASKATPKIFREDPVGVVLPNIIGTNNLLKIANEKQVENFIFFSTTGVYGFLPVYCYPVDEDCFGSINPTDLGSCYIESKKSGENLCIAWSYQYNVPVKIIRPSIIYGCGIPLDDGRVCDDFISSIINKKNLVLYSEGKVERSFCYIADFLYALLLVLIKGENRQAYNIASDYEISIHDLAHLLTEKVFPELGLEVNTTLMPERQFLRQQFDKTWMNIDKIKDLGWFQTFSLEDGFRRTINIFEEVGWK